MNWKRNPLEIEFHNPRTGLKENIQITPQKCGLQISGIVDWEYYLGKPLDCISRFISEGPWWWSAYNRWRNPDPRKEDTDTSAGKK